MRWSVWLFWSEWREREIVAACTQMEINGNLFEMLRQIKASIIPGHFPFCFAEGLFSLDNTVKCWKKFSVRSFSVLLLFLPFVLLFCFNTNVCPFHSVSNIHIFDGKAVSMPILALFISILPIGTRFFYYRFQYIKILYPKELTAISCLLSKSAFPSNNCLTKSANTTIMGRTATPTTTKTPKHVCSHDVSLRIHSLVSCRHLLRYTYAHMAHMLACVCIKW